MSVEVMSPSKPWEGGKDVKVDSRRSSQQSRGTGRPPPHRNKQNYVRMQSAPASNPGASSVRKRPRGGQDHGPARKRLHSSRGGNSGRAPLKFLAGGTISDPLNLEGLKDEAQSPTPVNSPLLQEDPVVDILVPADCSDPLNLNTLKDIKVRPLGQSAKKRRHRHRHRKSQSEDPGAEKSFETSLNTSVVEKDLETSSLNTTGSSVNEQDSLNDKLDKIVDIVIEIKPRRRSQVEHRRSIEQPKPRQELQPKQYRQKDEKFIYGNYNRYYGKRNPEQDRDPRLIAMDKLDFKSKDVLDIGCNIGHVTISIARDFQPRKILGIDIDGKLIAIARKNIQHYVESPCRKGYPKSFANQYGPLTASKIPKHGKESAFPNNVAFMQNNYVLDSDELIEMQRDEYDIVLALSVTKWIHLNWGDAGITRFFRRIFKQLRPGGIFVLEPQPWDSYKKKKNLTATIRQNYDSIKIRPERFMSHLLSSAVGFSQCDTLVPPKHKCKGFQRALQVYTKSASPPAGITPLMTLTPYCTPADQHTRPYTPVQITVRCTVTSEAIANGEVSFSSSEDASFASAQSVASSRHTEASSRHTEASSRHTEASSRHTDTSSRHSEPSSRHSEPSSRHSEPSSRHTEPSSEASSRHTDASSRHSEVSSRRSGGSFAHTDSDSRPPSVNSSDNAAAAKTNGELQTVEGRESLESSLDSVYSERSDNNSDPSMSGARSARESGSSELTGEAHPEDARAEAAEDRIIELLSSPDPRMHEQYDDMWQRLEPRPQLMPRSVAAADSSDTAPPRSRAAAPSSETAVTSSERAFASSETADGH